MAIAPSTPEERLALKRLTRRVRRKIKKLAKRGKRVRIIWDVDGVLVNSRSDDVFTMLMRDETRPVAERLKRYFIYEERLIAQHLEPGPWLDMAKGIGLPEGRMSQDIVTARSSFLMLRANYFLLEHRLQVDWQLSVGHQSKKDSYRIILEFHKKDKDACFVMVDDSAKHVRAFEELAEELGMADRCLGVCAPQLRDHDEDEIAREIALVLDRSYPGPTYVRLKEDTLGGHRRTVRVVPEPHDFLRDMFRAAADAAKKSAYVRENREFLEELARKEGLQPPYSDERLYDFWVLMHDIIVP